MTATHLRADSISDPRKLCDGGAHTRYPGIRVADSHPGAILADLRCWIRNWYV